MGVHLHSHTSAGEGQILEIWQKRASSNNIMVSYVRQHSTPICILHPYWIYGKSLSHFICCGWAYGYTLSLLHSHLCRWGSNFGKLGVKVSSNISIESIWVPSYAVDGHMGAPLHTYTISVGGGQILEIWGYSSAQITSWCHVWGGKPPKSVFHIHIGCMESFWTSSYAVDGHMGTLSHSHLCRWGQILENWG